MTTHKSSKSRISQQNYKRGLWAETIAMIYLMCKGYRPVRHRYKCKSGEVDCVVKNRNWLVFVEVKYRKNHDDALRSVSVKSQQRIRRTTEHFLNKYHLSGKAGDRVSMRFDVIAISPYFKITHIRNAF